MNKKIKYFHTGLTFRLVFGVMILLFIVNVITSVIGYIDFTESFTKEYTEATLHTADTAMRMLDADKIEEYLNTKGESREYKLLLSDIKGLCESQRLNVIYVIRLDTRDYGRFYSVINAVSKSSGYTPWEVGYEVESEGPSYVEIYRDLYENDTEYRVIESKYGVMGSMPFITAFVPVRDSEGVTRGILCVQRSMTELSVGRRRYLQNIAVAVLGIMIIAVAVSSVFLKRQFVRPTQKLIDEAKRFSKENSPGDFEKLNQGMLHEIREMQELSDAIEIMEHDTVQYMEHLKEVTATQERLSAELALASQIQLNILPHKFPPFPERNDFDIYATMETAKEVGGDFYDFFLIDEDHLAMVIADVSGKGVPAALFMMSTKIHLKTYTRFGSTPAAVLKIVNEEICRANKEDMFITVWLGVLTISTGEIIAANAGHEYPAIRRATGKFELIKDKHGLVLGGMSGARYVDYCIKLNTGDTLFLYTDGVPEATNADNELFGNDRMLDALNLSNESTVHRTISNVKNSIAAFVGDAEQFDDITMLCIKMITEDSEKTLTLKPDTESLTKASAFLEETAERWNLPMKITTTLQVVLDEIYSNIIFYSGATNTVVKLQKKTEEVEMILVDNGAPYDPTKAEDPDVTLSAEERKIGGLGIFMVKNMMDEINYRYEQGTNILVLKKKL